MDGKPSRCFRAAAKSICVPNQNSARLGSEETGNSFSAAAANCSTTREAPWRRQTNAHSHHSLGWLNVRQTIPLMRSMSPKCGKTLTPRPTEIRPSMVVG